MTEENINPEIQAMIDEYGEATVRAAFAIAQSIGREGIEGIDFIGAAEGRIRQYKYMTTRSKVESHMQRAARKR